MRSIPNHPASPDPAIPEPIGINERWDQPLTYYVIDDTCPASRPVVEIRQRSARRLVRSPDSKQRAHLLAGVNRLLRESLARVTGIDPAPRRSTSGSS